MRRSGRRAFQDIVVRIGQLNAYLGEQVGGLGVVQAYRREESCAREYRDINASHREATHRAVRFESVLVSAVQSIAVACVVLVLYYAAVKAGLVGGGARAAAYVGTVVAFYEYIGRFFQPIGRLAASFSVVQKAVASGERIFDLLEVTETDAAPATVSERQAPFEEAAEPVLSFRDVTFGYRAAEPVLHQVSFDVRRGERVAVVGATGAGKTTLTSLLLRLHDVQEGRVLVDGRDVRSLERGLLRRRFAAVPQDVFLFAGSLLRNVALGDGSPDAARAEEALRRVGAWSLVAARGGLDAEVVERGQNFSAGERQLIAFARALYRDAHVLLLDEATASVDSETEAKLERAVEALLAGRTALVIAHRLSTVRRADRILVMHRGRIVEQGTHAALLAAGGRYAKLCRLSASEE
jgi:ATP-binding cassette subfamily B protein